MKKLEGKVAVITGGNSGIGLATAKLFSMEGALVIVVGRDEKTLENVRHEGIETVRADVSQMSDLDRMYSEIGGKHGRIDILFANAGVASFVPLPDVSEKFYDQIMDINVKGLFFTVQKALRLMKAGGSIILTSSSFHGRAMPGGSVYGASKAAVRSLGRGFAADLAEGGIRVNVLTPGPVETPIFGKMGFSETQLKSMSETIKSRTPLKRMGRPEELAKVALFLASDDSSFMLGSEVAADGGTAQL
jgi:NAD(P)-dependent dehydrogenase (short-subunit alcohol dehydrogenase family)